jgi:hypothetical protein
MVHHRGTEATEDTETNHIFLFFSVNSVASVPLW